MLLHVLRHTKGELVGVRVGAFAYTGKACHVGLGHTAWLHGGDLAALGARDRIPRKARNDKGLRPFGATPLELVAEWTSVQTVCQKMSGPVKDL